MNNITGLIAFEVVARINRIDVDLRSIVKEFSIGNREITPEEFLRIAKRGGFIAKQKTLTIDKISGYPLPAVTIKKDGSFIVLLKINKEAGKAIYFCPQQKKTIEVDIREFTELISGKYIILKHKRISASIRFSLKWFFVEIMKYKTIISEVLLGSFVIQIFALITPLFTQVILDKVIVHHSMSTLNVLAVAFIAVAIFELLLNISRKYIFTHTASKLDAKLGAKLFRHLFALPFMYFQSRKVGNIIARVRELDRIRDFITNKAVTVIIDLIFSVVFVVVMFFYSFKLTLVVLGFVVLIALVYFFITPHLRERLEDRFKMAAQSNSYLVESVTGIQTVKSLSIEGAMQKKWEDHLAGYIHAGFRLTNMTNITSSISGFFQKCMTLTVLFLGVKLVILGKLSVGQLIAFNMISRQLYAPILRLVGLWHELQQSLLAVDRLGDILNQPIEIQTSKAITLPKINGHMKFENVGFKYTPDAPNAVENINFEVQPGMCVGFVGRSGSGKSTLAKLIQRLYVTNQGTIYLDDIDLKHLNPTWLRNNIGIVLQENYLFSGSIRENITLCKPDAPMELILSAARIAGAHEFIAKLPQGYDTIVGERGATLSGGQKQRIAICRALITNPRILIFDEATSALDYESEKIIQNNMEKIKKNRTMFIIAHRLSSVKDCDMIVVLDEGNIVETGTHDELIKKEGYYHKLYSMG